MFWLRLVTAIVVMATAVVIYEIAKNVLGERRALVATLLFGFLTSLRIVEGNLALTEIFMILPITLAMFIAILRKFDYISLFAAGFFLAIGSLYKQVGVLEAGALGIFLFLSSEKFEVFIKKGSVLIFGFTIPYLLTIAYFAPKNLVGEYIFAAYTYYQIYLGESPRYAILINFLKFVPIVAAVIWGLYLKRKRATGVFHLLLLWMAFSFLGSYFSGRTYGHYLVQTIPALSLVVASVNWGQKLTRAQIAFGVFFFLPLIFLTKILFTDFLSGGPINQVRYWQNFADFSLGQKGVDEYNNFFDRNVNEIMSLSDFFKMRAASSAYIWGDYPWLYAIADLANPSRYVTSFHVFGTPNGRGEVVNSLDSNPPDYIVKPPSSIGYFSKLENIIAKKYTLVSKIENSEVYERLK